MILTLSGMSTSGKTHLADQLLKEKIFHKAVTMTTRKPREGEIDGVHYHFVNAPAFKQFVDKGHLIEYVESHGAFYGTPKFEIERILGEGKSPVIVLEPIGVQSLRQFAAQKGLPMMSVFLQADKEILMARFFKRIEDEMLKGKFDRSIEAERLHVMLSQEMLWGQRWNWDLTLKNLHEPGRYDMAKSMLVAAKATRQPPKVQPIASPSNLNYTGPDVDTLKGLILSRIQGTLSDKGFLQAVFPAKVRDREMDSVYEI
ncbi:guanylate kinase [Pseudomonas nitritireducens]|uniref:Guanylate kinase n=1 Tax=Pseudomonas nitroreducens TaxID=46680 RepID=A0A7W7KF93_PSENT|nr:guanylate kinase [Pseudomonas nitritireducens]MBB4861331.1 guanylate kinase [Pseudomonas nitritireducens]